MNSDDKPLQFVRQPPHHGDQVRESVSASLNLADPRPATDELRRTAEQLRIVTDSMAATVTRCTRDLKYDWVSKLYADWIGRPAREIAGQPIIDVIGSEAFERLLPRFREVLSGNVVRYEEHVHFSTIGRRWISAVYTPTLGADRAPDGWVAVVNDLTERKEIEDALRVSEDRLRASERRWRTLAEALPNLVWTDLPDGQCDWLSTQWGKYTGIPENELLGLVWLDKVIHPDDRERTLACWQTACADEGDYDIEYRIRRYDGEYRWFKTRGVPVRDERGKIVYWFGTCTDIEDVKRLEADLWTSQRRLSDELQAMTRLHSLSSRIMTAANVTTALDDVLENAILTVGADFGNLQLFDPQTSALEIVAHRGFKQDFLDYFRRVRADEGSACAQAMQRGDRIVIEDVTIDEAFAPHRTVAAAAGYRGVQSTPLKSRDGSVLGMLSTHFRLPHRPTERDERLLDLYARHAADIIERFRNEQAFRDADRRKDESLATLAHELRNPLAPLGAGLEVIRLTKNDATVVEQMRTMMERQLEQMVRLIDDLLDVSRISRGKIELQITRIPLGVVVRNAVETSRPLMEQLGHELSLSMPDEEVYVDADIIRLSQVFANLLNNAAKYTDRGGQISLAVERQGSDAVVTVEDNGIGIPAHLLPEVFEMFTQLDRRLEKSQSGLGIGLTIAKRLVEMHGGSIEAASGGQGKGSIFTVCLPVVLSVAAKKSGGKAGAEVEPAIRRRILVVDDKRDTAASLAMMLKLMGNETRTANDGIEALEVAAEFKPDMILLDIGMPKLNGYDTCRRIREQTWAKEVVIVACTGWGQDEDKRKSEEAGFDFHIVKPVERAALMKLLGRVKPEQPSLKRVDDPCAAP
jgi:PAS domain S-box-containing protein